ncbi:MAG: HEAT repeat domain-containing protein [Acidobacteriia bacterium]|nr:HEAT repeat domain-containing protein [Terriglobia bacterium]
MVRGQLGDARFWKAIQYYTRKFSYQTATTSDFVEAIGEATGQDLEWLFDQYVYKPGHPEFEVSWDYDAANWLLHLSVKQNQKVDAKPAPFRVPIEIEALGDSSSHSRDIILKSINFKKAAAEWIWQLEHASRVVNRSEAALALGSLGGAEVIAALERAGTQDAFFGIRIDAAGSLGRIRTETARPAILRILNDKEAPVRAAAAGALGALNKNGDTVNRLLDLVRNDASYAVRQTALLAAARLKPDKGLDLVKPFLDMEPMRAAAVQAIQQIADEAAVPTLLDLSQDGDDRMRLGALRALGSLGKGKQPVTDRLWEALRDPDKADRQTAIFSVLARRETAAIPDLQRLAETEPLPNMARSARAALDSLRAPTPPSRAGEAPAGSDDLPSLRNRLSELEKENNELKARLDRLEKNTHAQ